MRALAQDVYRELRGAGYAPEQIVMFASEILALVSSELRDLGAEADREPRDEHRRPNVDPGILRRMERQIRDLQNDVKERDAILLRLGVVQGVVTALGAVAAFGLEGVLRVLVLGAVTVSLILVQVVAFAWREP